MDPLEELHIDPEIIHKLENIEQYRDELQKGETLQQIFGYSDELMESMYQATRQIFSQGEYKKAKDAFTFLSALNPAVATYWLGLGVSTMQLEEYEEAIKYLTCAIKLEKNDAYAYYYLAGCRLFLMQFEEGKDALLRGEKAYYDSKNEDSELFDRLQTLRAKFLNNKGR